MARLTDSFASFRGSPPMESICYRQDKMETVLQRSPVLALRYWKVMVLVAAGLLVFVLMRRSQRWASKMARSSTIASQCRQVPADETIFVSVVGKAGSLDETCRTVHSIFENAYCPLRVFVGVQQTTQQTRRKEAGLKNEQILQRYRHLTGGQETNLRILNEPTQDAKGSANARYMVERFLYKGEQFVMQMCSGQRLEADWDRRLIEDWKLLRLHCERPILTQEPAARSQDRPMWARLRISADTRLPDPQIASFANPPVRSFPAYYCCAAFYFCAAEAWADVPQDPWYDGASQSVYQWPHSVRLHAAGYRFYCPRRNVVYRKKRLSLDSTVKPPTKPENLMALYRCWQALQMYDGQIELEQYAPTKESLASYAEYTGIRFPEGAVEHGAQSGLWPREVKNPQSIMDQYSNEEVVAKYGSWAAFYQ